MPYARAVVNVSMKVIYNLSLESKGICLKLYNNYISGNKIGDFVKVKGVLDGNYDSA